MMRRGTSVHSCFFAVCLLLARLLLGGPAWAQEAPSGGASAQNDAASISMPASPGGQQFISDAPINSAFYKPSLYYPPLASRRFIPKLQRRAWFLALCAAALLALLTWPADGVKVLLWERARRGGQGGPSPAKLREAPAPEMPAPLSLVSRRVDESGDPSAGESWEADTVPLLKRVRRLDSHSSESAAEDKGPAAVYVSGPRRNPLRKLLWDRVQARFRLPLADKTVGAGLHIVECRRSAEETLNSMLIDLFSSTKGIIVVACAAFNETKLVNDLAGVNGMSKAESLAVLRRNSQVLDRCLKRLAMPQGQRLYAEEFLRQVEERSRKRGGVAAVFLDMPVRYEIGAYPKVMPVKEWCAALHGIAAHGAFPVFLLTGEGELPADIAYPRYTEGGPL